MTIKELLASLAHYLSEYLAKKFTGRFIFTVHVKDGGIGRVNVEIKHDLPRVAAKNLPAAFPAETTDIKK